MVIVFLFAIVIFFAANYFFSGATKRSIDSVIDKSASLEPQLDHFRKISISYWLTNGNKHYPSFFNEGDVLVFEKFILVTRKQWFFVSSWKKPLIISNRLLSERFQGTVENFIAVKFTYFEQKRKDVQIQLVSKYHSNITSVLSLRGMSAEQIDVMKSFEKRVCEMNLINTRN